MNVVQKLLNKSTADHRLLTPFVILFVTSLFLPTASHRVVFYVLSVFLIRIIIKSGNAHELIKTNCGKSLCIYLSFFTLSSLWSSPFDAYGFFRTAIDSVCVLVFTSSLAIAVPKISFNKRFAFTAAVVTFFAAIIYSLTHFMPGHYFRLEGGGRYTNPIHFGILLSVICLLLATAKTDRKETVFKWSLISFFAFLLFLTQARTALLALPVSMIALGLFGRLRSVLTFIGICAILCSAAIILFPDTFANFLGRADSYRFIIWGEALNEAKNHLWVGKGILTEPSFSPVEWNPGGFKSTHNVLIGHFFTGGLVGLGLFIILLFSAARPLLFQIMHELAANNEIKPMAKFTLAMFVFSSISSCFVFTHYIIGVHIHWLIFWTPFAFAWQMEMSSKAARAV